MGLMVELRDAFESPTVLPCDAIIAAVIGPVDTITGLMVELRDVFESPTVWPCDAIIAAVVVEPVDDITGLMIEENCDVAIELDDVVSIVGDFEAELNCTAAVDVIVDGKCDS